MTGRRTTRRQWMRDVLAAAGALAAWPAGRATASDFNRFRVAQVTVGELPPARPDAAFVLAQEVRFRTAVDVKLDRVVVPMGSPAIFDHPFLLWVGDGDFPPLTASERTHLARFVASGGFLVIDNAGEGTAHAAFDRRVRAELAAVLPGVALVQVPETHVVFRSFYRQAAVFGRRARRSFLEGAFVEDRLAVVLSHNDLAGAWSRDGFGAWQFEALPGGPAQREGAIRLGINLVMYALLLDYKDEQAHVETLLRRRRLRPEDPAPHRDPEAGD